MKVTCWHYLFLGSYHLTLGFAWLDIKIKRWVSLHTTIDDFDDDMIFFFEFHVMYLKNDCQSCRLLPVLAWQSKQSCTSTLWQLEKTFYKVQDKVHIQATAKLYHACNFSQKCFELYNFPASKEMCDRLQVYNAWGLDDLRRILSLSGLGFRSSLLIESDDLKRPSSSLTDSSFDIIIAKSLRDRKSAGRAEGIVVFGEVLW